MGEDLLADGGHVLAGDVEDDLAIRADLALAVGGQPAGGESAVAGLEPDDPLPGAGTGDAVEVAVVDLLAVVDDDDALAERRDVRHVVAGEQDGGPVAAVVVAQELADVFLRHDIEADGRFVEEEHARAVQQRRDQFHLHAFAERELAHHDVELGPDTEQCDEFVERLLVGRMVEAVDGAKQVE